MGPSMRGGVRPVRSRRGVTVLYVAIALAALFAVVSLAVDYGRVQLAKTQLQTVADAAARYAAAGMNNEINGDNAAFDNAAAVCAENTVDGTAVTIQASDVETGVWNSGTFTPNTNIYQANAVRVRLYRTAGRGTGIPLTFGRLLGRANADVTAESIAMVSFSGTANDGAGQGMFEYFIPATSNPWLSGMPAGSIASVNNPHNNPDYAGSEFVDDGKKKNWYSGNSGNTSGTGSGTNQSNWNQWGDYSNKKGSPIKAGTITVTPGSTITFDGINGGANNFASTTLYGGDGNLGWNCSNSAGAENGIADVTAPINSVIGIFLNNSAPNTQGLAPSALDFSTTASRDFDTLRPALRQPFFIGDGRRDSGEVQRFVVPAGATRLYVGTMDAYEWSNNTGGFYVRAHVNGTIVTVK
jgi:Flp pilus assembly protein TadG